MAVYQNAQVHLWNHTTLDMMNVGNTKKVEAEVEHPIAKKYWVIQEFGDRHYNLSGIPYIDVNRIPKSHGSIRSKLYRTVRYR